MGSLKQINNYIPKNIVDADELPDVSIDTLDELREYIPEKTINDYAYELYDFLIFTAPSKKDYEF
jgi:hypothetical protein